jgi:hypothetical protein
LQDFLGGDGTSALTFLVVAHRSIDAIEEQSRIESGEEQSYTELMPVKDTCKTCDRLTVSVPSSEGEQQAQLQEEHDMYLQSAETAKKTDGRRLEMANE